MITREQLTSISKQIPLYVKRAADTLISNGYEAYLVGGSVRDLIIGKIPKDYDIATNATPDEVSKIFPKSVATGARFGTITALIEDESGERFDVEITTYRSESEYFGGRWPTNVTFSKTIDDDLSRRDFTINALAINLEKVEDEQYLPEEVIKDNFNGLQDIQNKIIRAVGDPVERFSEDGLRPLRACRLASVLTYEIEQNTFDAINKTLTVVKMVAIERVREEILKVIYNSPKPSKGFYLMEQCGILELFIPELVNGKEFYQIEYHSDNVFEHSLKTMDLAEDDIKIAALFHDIGKTVTKTEDERGTHYYGHDIKGAEMTEEILKRLRFPSKEIKEVSNLIRWHMFYYPSADWRKDFDLDRDEDHSKDHHGWSDSGVRRFIMRVGSIDMVNKLLRLRIADATSNEKSHFNKKEIELFEKRIGDVMVQDAALKVTDLDIKGRDLEELGFKPGPIFTEILNYLLDEVLENPLLNNKPQLTELVKNKFIQK